MKKNRETNFRLKVAQYQKADVLTLQAGNTKYVNGCFLTENKTMYFRLAP